MAELTPNPIVVALAKKLVQDREAAAAIPADAPALDAPQDQARAYAASVRSVLNAFAIEDTPLLATYAGFIGGTVTGLQASWLVLYLDMKLLTWLLVATDDIVHTEHDSTGLFGYRDVIWVKAQGAVKPGEGRVEITDADFLTGGFQSAADYTATLSGGTFAPTAGAYSGALTPTCCTRRTN